MRILRSEKRPIESSDKSARLQFAIRCLLCDIPSTTANHREAPSIVNHKGRYLQESPPISRRKVPLIQIQPRRLSQIGEPLVQSERCTPAPTDSLRPCRQDGSLWRRNQPTKMYSKSPERRRCGAIKYYCWGFVHPSRTRCVCLMKNTLTSVLSIRSLYFWSPLD
jgi:hypothetical protein